MSEMLGKFWNFYGDLIAFFWKSFSEETGVLFSKVAESPGSSWWELLICIFLVTALLTMIAAVVVAVIKMSPVPFIRIIEAFTRYIGYIGAYVIVLLVVSMVWEVIARYFFSAPTKWAFEVAYMLMGTSFMFGIAFCMQQKRHVRVDFLYDNVGDKGRAIIDLFGYFFLVPMLLWLCGGLWEYFHAAYRVDEVSGESAWNPIIWPFKFTLVAGFLMLFMQVAAEIVKCVMALAGREVPGPVYVETETH